MSDLIQCNAHGTAGAAFVCVHAHLSYEEGQKRPFFWSNEENQEPCGWCGDCQIRFEAAGNEWAGDAEAELNAKLICEHCFRDTIKFNGYT